MPEARPQNLCLTAGAGAGKTYRLVQTYVGLLAGGEGREALEPEQVVAITFTDKAALEMRTRVEVEIQRLAQEDPDRAQRWQEFLPRIEWAPISTIHSFCANLLREFGQALGLDPEFAVLDQRAFAELQDEVLADFLRQKLASGDANLARLLAQAPLYGPHGVAGMLAWSLGQLSTNGLEPKEAQIASIRAHDAALAQAPELAARLGRAVADLEQALDNDLVNRKAKFAAKLLELLGSWPQWNGRLSGDPLNLELLGSLHGLLRGNWGKVNDLRQEADGLVDELTALAGVAPAAEMTSQALELVAGFKTALEAELAARSALGFDDLLLKTGRLLHVPGILAELRGRYRALLVDEFQDVNPVQGRMVRLLAGLDQPEAGGSLPSLLLVGDRKQAIYAFRGADVGLFSRTMQSFAAGEGTVEALPNNYRSRPGLVGFFNRVFAQVFGAAPEAEDGGEGVTVRFREDDRQAPAREEEPSPLGPAVEILEVTSGDELSAEAWREQEAQALAAYLANLMEEKGLKPGQAAILLRKLTQVQTYELALARAGVDFYTVRGRGFFAGQEVRDAVMAMRATLFPDDELALAAFLVSPLAGLSQEALLALAHTPEGQYRGLARAVGQGVEPPAWLAPDQAQCWRNALDMLTDLRPWAQRMTPAELLEELYARSDLLAVMAGSPAGQQKTSNLRKLLEEAREAGGGAVELAREWTDRLDAPADDPQAPILGSEAEVVNIMSVHQAKGLEFPLVILADLAGKPGGNSWPGLGPDGVASFRPRDLATGQRLDNPVYQMLKARARLSEQAETARLFYVACTRAREKLVLCLTGAKRTASTPWANWAAELAAEDKAAVRVSASDLTGRAAPGSQPEAAAWPDLLPPDAGPAQAEGQALVKRCLSPQAPPLDLVRESVSSLEDWFTCPRRYVFTRRLGLDTAWLAGGGEGPGQGGEGAELGSQVHQYLETADLAAGPPLAGEDQVLERARGFWDTELAGLAAGLPPEAIFREQKFVLNLPAQEGFPAMEVIGEFDLLMASEKGLVLADYKVTAKVEPEHYRDQLGIYSLALWRAGEGKAPLPKAALCYLTPKGGKLVWLEFSQAELRAYEQRIYQAAASISRPPARPSLGDLPRGEDCGPTCALARAGLCPPKEPA